MFSTIGTDPEFFLKDKESNKYISAIGLIPGKKYEPHIMKCGAGLQVDNVAVEFASLPANSPEELIKNIKEPIAELTAMLPEHLILDYSPSAIFEDEQLMHDDAKEFGCSESYDAWEVRCNPKPEAANTQLRSIGAHVHIGHRPGDNNEFLIEASGWGKINAVQSFEATAGIIGAYMDATDEARARKELYGKSGEHRPTSYGVECRSLGPWWLKNEDTIRLIYYTVQDSLKIVRDSKLNDLLDTIGVDNIKNIVNQCNKEIAEEVIQNILIHYLSDDTKEILNKLMNKKTIQIGV